MAGGYVLCEYETVRETLPEFKETMEELEASLLAKAIEDWGDKYGGFKPTGGQFGKSTIMPQLFFGLAGAMLVTWDQWLTATGSQTIMTGANAGAIYADYKVGVVGLAFLDKAIKISEIKMQIIDKKLPRINIEEAFVYNKPAVVFEEGFILDEKTGFDLLAYVLAQGQQRIKLIGLQLNKVPNKLQITNTGAALQ